MPELRQDPIADRWVVIAPERGKRPSDFFFRTSLTPGRFCPLCPGHESDTPPELFSVKREDGWSVRVVPNLFPALDADLPLERSAEGLYDRVTGVGAHEVVVETPDHAASLATVPPRQLEDVFAAWRERIVDLSRDLRLRWIQVFKNHGAPAGATLEHEHSQLIALPLVPGEIEAQMRNAARWYRRKERCVFCDLMRQDRGDGTRVVYENEAFLVTCPWASRTPFLTRIMPRTHRSSFESTPAEELAGLADALHVTLGKLDEALERPAYNAMLHSNVLRHLDSPSWHWHLDVAPVLTRPAGFEWSTGTFLNPTPPEEAAEFLRKTSTAASTTFPTP